MILFEHAKPFILLVPDDIPDDTDGYIADWTEGEEFLCLLFLDKSTDGIIAEQQGVSAVFTGTVDKAFPLKYHDVIKRKEDGELFRVISNPNDNRVPDIATVQVKEFKAEKYTLPR